MSTSENQTRPTSADVAEFLAGIEDPQQSKESQELIDIMHTISGKPPVMWGPSIIGFGSIHYKYDSGREGDMPVIGFSPRKGKFSLYITDNADKYPEIRKRLGKHKTSKACIYINRLADVDSAALKELIEAGFRDSTRVY